MLRELPREHTVTLDSTLECTLEYTVMETISTTQLRTKSTQLIDTLNRGGSVSLIHRSRKVATISPTTEFTTHKPLPVSEVEMQKIIKSHSKLQRLSQNERKKRYSTHLASKYG